MESKLLALSIIIESPPYTHTTEGERSWFGQIRFQL